MHHATLLQPKLNTPFFSQLPPLPLLPRPTYCLASYFAMLFSRFNSSRRRSGAQSGKPACFRKTKTCQKSAWCGLSTSSGTTMTAPKACGQRDRLLLICPFL